MACSTPTYQILRCICDEIPEEDRTNDCQGEIIANINNDLYEAYTILLKIYKNKIIDFEDNNISIIPYGSLYIKDSYDNRYYSIQWKVKDEDNKIIAKGSFIS